MILQTPALSRSRIDRAAHRRAQDGLLDDLLSDPAARVLLLDGDRAPVVDTDGGVALAFVEGDRAELAATVRGLRPTQDGAGQGPQGPVLAFLGDEPGPAGTSYLLVAAPAGTWIPAPALPGVPVPGVPTPGVPVPGVPEAAGSVPGARWAGLREVGHVLDAADAGLLTTAVALAEWHRGHGWCARCGTRTAPVSAGWSRRCRSCEREHFPRLDPAVIMAVTDADDRLLLGRQMSWPPRRVSVLAGFVEPGESLEAAVRREVLEEVGVPVDEVTYQGNQPWPFPSSLMLGFSARAAATDLVLDGDEIAEASWWTREALGEAVAAGRILVPSQVSIARWLVERWYGGPVPDTGEPWR